MPVWHGDKGKKKTGGKVKSGRGKKKFELGRNPTWTKIGKEKKKVVKKRGGSKKVKAMAIKMINVYDPSSKKTKKVEIKDVVENPANPHLVRRRIITKGTTVETELGVARVTSRPSQEGIANGVLVKSD